MVTMKEIDDLRAHVEVILSDMQKCTAGGGGIDGGCESCKNAPSRVAGLRAEIERLLREWHAQGCREVEPARMIGAPQLARFRTGPALADRFTTAPVCAWCKQPITKGAVVHNSRLLHVACLNDAAGMSIPIHAEDRVTKARSLIIQALDLLQGQ
jgi:hypothetical protein